MLSSTSHLIKFCQLCSVLVSFVKLCSPMFTFVQLFFFKLCSTLRSYAQILCLLIIYIVCLLMYIFSHKLQYAQVRKRQKLFRRLKKTVFVPKWAGLVGYCPIPASRAKSIYFFNNSVHVFCFAHSVLYNLRLCLLAFSSIGHVTRLLQGMCYCKGPLDSIPELLGIQDGFRLQGRFILNSSEDVSSDVIMFRLC